MNMDNKLHTRWNTSINYRAGGYSEKDVSCVANNNDDIRTLQLENYRLALINNEEKAQAIMLKNSLIARMIEKNRTDSK